MWRSWWTRRRAAFARTRFTNAWWRRGSPARNEPAGGGDGEAGLVGRSSADVSTVGARAVAVAAVRLGRWAPRRRAQDVSVLRLAGLVAVPGGDPGVGPDHG